jgi:hypothetical protein
LWNLVELTIAIITILLGLVLGGILFINELGMRPYSEVRWRLQEHRP